MVRLNPRSFRVLNQDGASDMMHSVEGADHVGALLREAREASGRSVADVVASLRIRRVYLEAIEDGRFDELPGAAYAVGFVRSYATYLRLDAPTLVERFKEEATGIQAPQELEFPTPVPEGRFPGGLLVTLCLLLAGAAIGGWYWYQSQNGIDVARVPPPPDNTAAPEAVTAPVGPGSPPVTVTAETPVDPPPVETATVESSTVEPAPTPAPTPATTAAPSSVGTGAAETDPPEADASDTPLVPPSYLEPQVDPLASMADVPTIAERDGAAATRAPDAVAAAPDAAAPSTQTTEGESPANDTPAEQIAAAPPTEDSTPADPASVDRPAAPPTAADATEPAVVPVAPPPPSFSSEPAIVALPEVESAPDAPPVAQPDRDGRVFGARNATARIILSARENTWVQVRDAEENVVLTQMLLAGDRYRVPNRDGLRLMTGNAGGLEILVDGDAVPAIGDRGQSRRDVQLDPNLLKAGTAVVR